MNLSVVIGGLSLTMRGEHDEDKRRTGRKLREARIPLLHFQLGLQDSLFDTRYTIKRLFPTVTITRLFPLLSFIWCQTSNKFHTSWKLLKLLTCHMSSRRLFPYGNLCTLYTSSVKSVYSVKTSLNNFAEQRPMWL